MRLTSSAVLHKRTVVQDAYGGEDTATTTTTTIPALISIANDELKPLPSGFGYYRKLTCLIDRHNAVAVGHYIEVNGIEFYIAKVANYSSFHMLLVGYET